MLCSCIAMAFTVEPPLMDTVTSRQPPTKGQIPCRLPTTACTQFIPNLQRTDTSNLQIMDTSPAPNCHCTYIITSHNGQRTCMRQLGFNYRLIDLKNEKAKVAQKLSEHLLKSFQCMSWTHISEKRTARDG